LAHPVHDMLINLPTVKLKCCCVLLEVVLWFGGIRSEQRKNIACHVELQLYCATLVELVSKDYLHQTK